MLNLTEMKTSKVFFIILDRIKTIPGEYPF
jgi:hypothetical protein